MRISLIAAVAENYVIGNGDQIPWRLKSDMRYFKAITLDKPVIMGRKTWESLGGKALPQRTNIVVTRSVQHITPHETLRDVFFVPDIETAQVLAGQSIRPEYYDNPEILFMGGSEIYRDAIPYCNRMYITRVYAQPKGDVYFPESAVNWDQWCEKSVSRGTPSEENDYVHDYVIYDRTGRIPKEFLRHLT